MNKTVKRITKIKNRDNKNAFRLLTEPGTSENDIRNDPEIIHFFGKNEDYILEPSKISDVFILKSGLKKNLITTS